MNILQGIQWAPLNVSLRRRLQTLGCIIRTSLYLAEPLYLYLYYRMLYSAYWWVAILYLMWMIYDIEVCHRGGRICEYFRNWSVWRHYCDYFPIRLVKTAELDPSKNYLFGCFPHGVVSFGAFGAFATNALAFYKAFPGMTVNMITLRGPFIIPFLRELYLALGGCSASLESLLHLLNSRKKGKCAALVVGGSAEILDTYPGQYNVKLKDRKGFVRIALMTGSEWVRNWTAWRHFCDYFPIKLVKTAELDPSKNYIFSCFPHGVVSFGAFGAFSTNALGFYKTFPGMSANIITLRERLIIPIIRELFLAWGACSSSLESLLYLLNPKKQKGKCVVLIIGGSSEVLDLHPGQYNLRLKDRRGFVRVAMMTGASLVPVLSFGETNLFRDFNYPEGTLMRRWHKWFVRVIGLIPVVPTGRGIFQYTFGFQPYRVPITVVVGAPIDVERNLDPTKEEVDAVHATFIDKLVELFENEKAKYIPNHEDVKLVIN